MSSPLGFGRGNLAGNVCPVVALKRSSVAQAEGQLTVAELNDASFLNRRPRAGGRSRAEELHGAASSGFPVPPPRPVPQELKAVFSFRLWPKCFQSPELL
jgi:hypothetical protein